MVEVDFDDVSERHVFVSRIRQSLHSERYQFIANLGVERFEP